MAYLTTLKGKKVGVLGLGVSGLSCVCYLMGKDVVPFVMDGDLQSAGVQQVVSQWPQMSVFKLPTDAERYPDVLLDADLLIVSPGVPLSLPILIEAANHGVQIIGDVELFARLNRQPVIAISGSNGKSTVTKLVTELLKNGGYDAVFGGNIGVPVLDLLAQPFDVAVLELSSFQLETTSSLHAQTATILNLSEDHMDRYESYDAYAAAKQRIYSHADIAVYNRADVLTLPSKAHPSHIGFGLTEPEHSQNAAVGIRNGCFAQGLDEICPVSALNIVGQHNVLNALAAIALVQPFKLSHAVIEQTFKQFTGLSHRCERIEGTGEVSWINDSKATNVGATVAALNGLKPQCMGNLILLAGGVGKSADFAPLQQALENHVDYLITFGRDGDQIGALVTDGTKSIGVRSMEEAVLKAFALANSGDCVLLSPACASFDMFANFEARGDHFAALVKEICHVD